MLKSVYKYGGFWIGRYETGAADLTNDDPVRTETSGTTNTPTIKEGQIVYDFVTSVQAEQLAKTLNPNSNKYNTDLLFGVQWDLTMKYLESKKVENYDLKNDSGEFGNYEYVEFDLQKGKYTTVSSHQIDKWVTINEKFTKEKGKDILFTTGATDRNCKQNIYDLAGNIWEWTFENSPQSDRPCVKRGGCYVNDEKTKCPANERYEYYLDDTGAATGFRVSLYKK